MCLWQDLWGVSQVEESLRATDLMAMLAYRARFMYGRCRYAGV